MNNGIFLCERLRSVCYSSEFVNTHRESKYKDAVNYFYVMVQRCLDRNF